MRKTNDMEQIKVAFFDTKPYDRETFDAINKKYNFSIKYYKYHLTPDNVVLTEGYDAVIVFVNDTITADMIVQMHKNGVKLIALRSAGYNNVDLRAALNRIRVVRVPAYSPYAVAEHTVALMLTLNRKTHRAYNRTREGNFALSGLMGFDMHGKTAGVVGTGKIGKTLISILNGFGMEVLAYDKFPDNNYEKAGNCRYVEMDELLGRSDVISLNCPLSPETEYMINKNSIAKMKDGVMIINTGRGKLIKTSDLIEGLKNEKIGSAGLDVYEEESQCFFEDLSDRIISDDVLARLLSFNNVIITSHQGFFTREALHNIAETTMDNIKKVFDNKIVENEICINCQMNPGHCKAAEAKR
jgi:D-lactate dehydrogenase